MKPTGTKKIPPSVYLRYTLLNLPGALGFILILILVRQGLMLPPWLFWALITGWVAKEVLLFPVVWRAYERPAADAPGALVGECGVAKKRLDPCGYIQVRGELWRAEHIGAGPPIEAGRLVRIRKMKGLTLYVVPEEAQYGK